MREISICSHKCCIAPAREVNALPSRGKDRDILLPTNNIS
jgi:hypothetical protein